MTGYCQRQQNERQQEDSGYAARDDDEEEGNIYAVSVYFNLFIYFHCIL